MRKTTKNCINLESIVKKLLFIYLFIDNFKNDFRYQLEEDGSLTIKKLTMEDSGMFQCLASNEAGEASSYTWIRAKSKNTFK